MANSLLDVAASAASDVGNESAKAARRVVDEGKAAAKQGLSSAAACFESEVAAKPYQAVAVALGVGALIGMLIMRR